MAGVRALQAIVVSAWRSVIRRPAPLLPLLALAAAGGCATPGYQRVRPTELQQARQEVPEELLLDVGVAVTEAPELPDKQLERQGTTADVRKSERWFIPFHLKATLQQSSYWGAVQVVPPEEDSLDLTVTTELVKSNGETMQIKVQAVDAGGRTWLKRNYEAKLTPDDYTLALQGVREPFQDVYNTIANDLSAFMRGLSPQQIEEIRTVSRLEFAEEMAPDAFDGYLAEDRHGQTVIEHLPADDDPLMERIDRIREREAMFLDTLNQYYEGYYAGMWDAYRSWRKFNLDEQIAKRQVQQQAFMQTMLGIAMIAAAVLLEVGDVGDTGAISGILILAGGQVVINGINVSQQAQIHESAIQELAESFGSDMRPTVVELEGKQYELTGTASEQFERFRELLRQIYLEETGFGEEAPASAAGA